jgi:hypothetical protein
MQRDNLLLKELAMLIEKDASEYQLAFVHGKKILRALSFAQEFYTQCAKDNAYIEYLLSRGIDEKTMHEW